MCRFNQDYQTSLGNAVGMLTFVLVISYPVNCYYHHCWLSDRKGMRPVKITYQQSTNGSNIAAYSIYTQLKTGCWFVGGDDLAGVLHDLQLQ